MNVNGPVNAVRLEGNVFNIDKIIYIFMDFHSDISMQTQCEGFNSIDLVNYIVNMFKQSDKDKTFDLFSEITRTAIYTSNAPYRGRYIDEVNKYLKHEFKNKNKLNPNVRIHYVDIRDYIQVDINAVLYNIYNIVKSCCASNYISKYDYGNIMQYLTQLYNSINVFNQLFRPISRQFNSKPVKKVNIELVRKFINKILSKYKHKIILTKFQELFDIVKNNITKILDLIQQTIDLMNSSYDFISKPINSLFLFDYGVGRIYTYGKDNMKFINFKNKLELLINQIDRLTIETFALIVDIYFLRRFLDKDYITNGIIYVGNAHALTYVYFLVKYFDFKITHVSYSRTSIDNIQNFIKKSTYGPEMAELFLPPILSQCVNMAQFPVGFS